MFRILTLLIVVLGIHYGYGLESSDMEIIPGIGIDPVPGACVCPQINAPVCCGRQTYSNQCSATCEGFGGSECSPGECSLQCFCTADAGPYCCDGTTEYGSSACYPAECHPLSKCTPGECSLYACTQELVQLCCDGVDTWGPGACIGTIGDDECDSQCCTIDAVECVSGKCEDNNCACTEDLSPYCCNGEDKQGPSSCSAPECYPFDISQCEKGECGRCVCTKEYNPLCCDGKTYGNLCNAECAGFKEDDCSQGECSDCVCTEEYEPVCCDGTTYSNQCKAGCDGFTGDQCESGECPCICTADYTPVCCDGTTYSNQCGAECDGFTADQCQDGECSTSDLCLDTESPVCCGGQTYDNFCKATLQKSSDDICCPGKCGKKSVFRSISNGLCDRVRGSGKEVCCDGYYYRNEFVATCNGYVGCEEFVGEVVPCCNFFVAPSPDEAVCCGGIGFPTSCDAECYGFDVGVCTSGQC
eukprot:TRINITY_DN901_c0_g1_i7.p1 TRINITY_DN901_c0_g1~~TRINITY_DN901_c0_g1_i7.p1  ORF type:complete len:520 (+),score=33.21 TRINITY_DN901_c0_g1_i7:146-1561(+)